MRVEDVDQAVVAAATRTPFEATRRVFVLERVDTMNDEVANRLLKTLEEPAHFVHLILLTDALGRVLETVVSRCQPVRFEPLPAARIAAVAGGRGRRGPGRRGVRAAGARQRGAGAPARLARGRGAARGGGRLRGGCARRRAGRGLAAAAGPRRAAPRRGRGGGGRRGGGPARARAQGPRATRDREGARGGRQARRPPRPHRGARPGADADRAGLPRPGLPRRADARGGAGRATARRRWRSAPARATRAGCARPPSAARRCARRWS